MATLQLHRDGAQERARLADHARAAFWVLCVGFLATYAFFAALGAFTPAEADALTIAAAVVLGLWTWHAVGERQAAAELRDPAVRASRERRGF